MGMFDTYGHVQIKAGDPQMNNFRIGDSSHLPDGVYVAPDGVVVICGGKFVAVVDKIYTKWGEELDVKDVLRGFSPFDMAVQELREEGIDVGRMGDH
jgi:hypothetical protein